MSNKKRYAKRDDKPKSSATEIALGTVVSVFSCFLILAVFAAISYKSGISASAYVPAGIAAAVISGFAGGFASVRPIKEKGVLYGAVCGVISSVLCMAILFVINGNKAGNGIFIFMAAMILGGAAGGISAVNLKIKKKY